MPHHVPTAKRQPPEALEHIEHPPALPLRPYVTRFLETYSKTAGYHVVHVPPSGASYLTFVHGSPFYFRMEDGSRLEAPSLFLGGQLRNRMPVAEVWGHVQMFGVEFAPTAVYRLFHADCGELTDRMTDFEEVLPRRAGELRRALSTARDAAERIRRLEVLLTELAANALDARDVEDAIHHIEQHRGRTTVATLAKRCGLSQRQLNRHFLRQVGLGPKHFAKVVQLKEALAALQNAEHGELQRIAHGAGYYDQSHFVRDLKRLVGISPMAFLRAADPFLEMYMSNERLDTSS